MISVLHLGKKTERQQGFTIVELMIAAGVLSTILLMVTFVMINIGNLYYKGLNQSRVQDATRSITEELSQQLRLNGQVPPPQATWPAKNEAAICIGNVRYTYVLGVQIGSVAPGTTITYPHVLWRDTNPTPGSSDCWIQPPDATHPDAVSVDLTDPQLNLNDPSGDELIPPNSRLTQFSIAGTISGGSPYDIALGIAYGDNDLLCNPTVVISGTVSCARNAADMPSRANYTDTAPNGIVRCKGFEGDQYCAASRLNTTVVTRL